MLIRVIFCLNEELTLRQNFTPLRQKKTSIFKLGTMTMVFCILSRVILLFSVHLFTLARGMIVVSATIIPLSLDNALHG